MVRLPLPQFSENPGDRGDRFAEVIETATTEFLAQCLDGDELRFPTMPPFGSWVKAIDEESGNPIYGVVYHATTTPIDSVHRAQALGMSLEELRDRQPQIFAMLKTEFRAAIVGFVVPESGQVYQYLPPRPPQIHQGVAYCTPEEVIDFSEGLDFLRTLLEVGNAPVEALTAAAVREIYQIRKTEREWLVRAGRTLSLLLKDDYDRLRLILGQIHP